MDELAISCIVIIPGLTQFPDSYCWKLKDIVSPGFSWKELAGTPTEAEKVSWFPGVFFWCALLVCSRLLSTGTQDNLMGISDSPFLITGAKSGGLWALMSHVSDGNDKGKDRWNDKGWNIEKTSYRERSTTEILSFLEWIQRTLACDRVSPCTCSRGKFMCYFLLSFWNVVLGREENIRGDLFIFFVGDGVLWVKAGKKLL